MHWKGKLKMAKTKRKIQASPKAKNNPEMADIVYLTKDYSIFNFIEGNRSVNAIAYAKLVKSFDKKSINMPILVNEKMEIVDGQSRFMILKEKKLPVHYIVKPGYGINEVMLLNSSGSRWTRKNYLSLYCKQESPEYVYFSNLMEEYAVGINTLIKIFAYYQKKTMVQLSEEFEAGEFTTDECEKAEDFLTTLNMFKEARFIHYLDSCFVSALLHVTNKQGYSDDIMKKTFRKKAYSKQESKKDYVRNLVNIYNSCSKVKIKHDVK